jgi:hypothetical protein
MVMFANASGGFNTPVNSGISNINHTQAIASEYACDGRTDFWCPSGGTLGGAGTAIVGEPGEHRCHRDGASGNARSMDLNGDGLDDLVFGDRDWQHAVGAGCRLASGGYAAAGRVRPCLEPGRHCRARVREI